MTRAVGPATGRVTNAITAGTVPVTSSATAPGHAGHCADHSDHGDGERPAGPESAAASAADGPASSCFHQGWWVGQMQSITLLTQLYLIW